jgi:hypothetical protein
MSDHLSETRASLVISSEVVPRHRVAEILELQPSKILDKGTPTGQADSPEHPFNVAMFESPLAGEERLESHLDAILAICEQREDKLLTLTEHCKINVHCTYLIHDEGGWSLTQDLCRRTGSLPVEYVFAIQPRSANNP